MITNRTRVWRSDLGHKAGELGTKSLQKMIFFFSHSTHTSSS